MSNTDKPKLGRPPTGQVYHPLCITVSNRELEYIDKERGHATRTSWFRNAIGDRMLASGIESEVSGRVHNV